MGRISQEVAEQIPILYDKYKVKSRVAKELGISTSTVSRYLIAAGDVESKSKPKKLNLSEEEINKLNESYKKSQNMAAVSREFNIPYSSIKKFLTDENLELSKKQYDSRDALWFYIIRTFGVYSEEQPVSDWNIAQMNKFKKQGMSFRGQLLTLKYFYEIKGNSTKKSKGSIGIIPFVFDQAFDYYRREVKKQQEILNNIESQLARDRIEIEYKPQDYLNKKKKRKKEIDLSTIKE